MVPVQCGECWLLMSSVCEAGDRDRVIKRFPYLTVLALAGSVSDNL